MHPRLNQRVWGVAVAGSHCVRPEACAPAVVSAQGAGREFTSLRWIWNGAGLNQIEGGGIEKCRVVGRGRVFGLFCVCLFELLLLSQKKEQSTPKVLKRRCTW